MKIIVELLEILSYYREMKNNWINNSHIMIDGTVGFLNAGISGNGSSGCFFLRVTVYSNAAILPGLKANFGRLIAVKNSGAVVLKKQTDKPGSFPAKKKFSPDKFWKPSDDLRKLSVDLQKSPDDLRKSPADLQNSSDDLQKSSVDLEKLSAGLHKYSVDLQKLSVDLQKLSAGLQKYSAGLQKLSVDLQKYSVE